MTTESPHNESRTNPYASTTTNLDDRRLPSYSGNWGWLVFVWDCLRFGILPTLAARQHARKVLARIDADVQAGIEAEAPPVAEPAVEPTPLERADSAVAEPTAPLQPPVEKPAKKPLEKPVELQPEAPLEAQLEPQLEPPKPKVSFMARLRAGMSRSKSLLTDELRTAGRGLDDDTLEELEMRLVSADVGIATTTKIIAELVGLSERGQRDQNASLLDNLKAVVADKLAPCEQPLDITTHTPFVLLMVGVNGVGKTTTIGKLAKKFQQQGQSVMLAAGDTFRAAAVEQLKTWGERNNVPVVAQAEGADSASVLFDAFESAKAKQVDVLIADTAGRLHTQSNLMEELKKIVRVLKKLDDSAPHEVMLVLDGGTGQNALSQAKQFQQAVDVSGVTVTKLDGTAKGGIIVAIADQLQIPIRFIGVGESVDDLGEFHATEFAQALIGE